MERQEVCVQSWLDTSNDGLKKIKIIFVSDLCSKLFRRKFVMLKKKPVMTHYPSIQLVKRDLRNPQSPIYQNEMFYYKDIPCVWDNFEDNVFDRLRCDPSTLQQSKDFYRLQNHLEPNIIVDFS